MSSQSLHQINQLLKDLQSSVSILNQSKAQINSKSKDKAFSVSKKDKRKIIKLFQHPSWEHFIKWVNDKLLESGQNQPSEQTHLSSTNQKKSLQTTNQKKSFQTTNDQPLEDTFDFQFSQQFKLSERDSQQMQQTKTRDKLETKRSEMTEREQEELQLLALQNGRLRRQNIILKNKLIEIRSALPE